MRTITALCLLVFALPVAAQSEEDMAAAMAMAQPDEHHEFLHHFVGAFDYSSQFWMQPGAPPMTMEGSAASEMILGGRYLSSVNEGVMMGMPFEGHGLTAFDRMAGEYVSTWVDNMGTGIMVFRGQRDGDRLVVEAEYHDPQTDAMQRHRMEQWPTDDGYLMEYYITPAGGEAFKSMVITYTRDD